MKFCQKYEYVIIEAISKNVNVLFDVMRNLLMCHIKNCHDLHLSIIIPPNLWEQFMYYSG